MVAACSEGLARVPVTALRNVSIGVLGRHIGAFSNTSLSGETNIRPLSLLRSSTSSLPVGRGDATAMAGRMLWLRGAADLPPDSLLPSSSGRTAFNASLRRFGRYSNDKVNYRRLRQF